MKYLVTFRKLDLRILFGFNFRVPVVEDPQQRMRPGDLRDAAEVPLLHGNGIDLSEMSEVDKNHLSSKLD